MTALKLLAGPTAFNTIRREGLRPDLFRVVAGASGGPKWFVLYGLDRYLFSEFLSGPDHKLVTIGSSAGAWRLACLGTAAPLAAIDRLADVYSRQRYSDKPTAAEVTASARTMVADILGPDGGQEIVSNQRVGTHFVTNRCKGVNSFNKFKLGGNMALSALSNMVSRSALGLYLERTLFSSMGAESPFTGLTDFPTRLVKMTQANVHDALLASGSIPFALEGVRNIAGAAPGLYVDGGIIDYHFDLPFHQEEGLVLYPHFATTLIPGWFDKKLVWRKPGLANYHNVLLLAPSDSFVQGLPYGKIPDRGDFKSMGYATRLNYWQIVMKESERLADEFIELLNTGDVSATLERLTF